MLKIRYSPHTFIRHCDGESLIWHRRNYASLILRDAEPFLKSISRDYHDVNQIIVHLANCFGTDPNGIVDDFYDFISPLIENGLAETQGSRETLDPSVSNEGTVASSNNRPSGDENPFADFYLRHNIPRELHIDLTSACTERCVHCYIAEYHSCLEFELIRKALTEFRDLGGMTVYVSGGECMLHPRFGDVLHECRKLDLNMIVLSNLTLCCDETIELLKEVDPHFVKVSLYSMDPGHHDAITRLPGSWHKTMEAFLKLESNGIPLELASPVLKENQYDFADLAAFAEEHHVYLVTNPNIFAKCNHDNLNLEHALSPDEFRRFLEKHYLMLNRTYAERIFHPEERLCDVGTIRLCLNSEGNYYPCDGCHGLILGNVKEHTIREVWNGEPLERLRKLKQKDFPRCLKCVKRSYCKICLAENFSATGDILQIPEGACKYSGVRREFYGKLNADMNKAERSHAAEII
ncbi:MAG: radical SAM protein [Lentisphaeria bacterium]|nr:radical SAM protein [Lentisphaeria bacterium]